jgi:hypothetical protein
VPGRSCVVKIPILASRERRLVTYVLEEGLELWHFFLQNFGGQSPKQGPERAKGERLGFRATIATINTAVSQELHGRPQTAQAVERVDTCYEKVRDCVYGSNNLRRKRDSTVSRLRRRLWHGCCTHVFGWILSQIEQ